MRCPETLSSMSLLFTHTCPVTEFAVASHLNTVILYLINKKNKLKRLANVGRWAYNKSNSQMPFKL